MRRGAKATEGQWGHLWASTAYPELHLLGQEEHAGLSDHCLLPPALHSSSSRMLAAGPPHPHLSPLSSPSPTLLPSLTCCLWRSDTVSMSCPCSTDTHSLPIALTPWAPSFSISPATHTLLSWFSPDALSPTPRTFLESPILFSHVPIPFLPLFLLLTPPSLASESPTLALAWWPMALAWWQWPKPGTSVPEGP